MKVLFYSPYLHILGGGERHLFSFAHCLSQQHQVYVVWKNPHILTQAQDRFNLDLSQLKIIPFLPPRFQLKAFDLLFFVSDGSIPFLPVGKSAVFFMSPFLNVHGHSLINQIKLKFINHIVCNSHYTKKFIDAEFNINSTIIYPAVNLPKSRPQSKQNIILSVGRFSRTLHQKNHQALIQAFIDLEPQLSGWKLVLVGGTEPGSEPVLQPLLDQARNHHIILKTDIPNQELHKLYSQARIYWHAAGFGSDLIKHPQQAEHFGISVVEAMSYGCVPIVFAAGGPTEIVTSASGITWDKLSELKQQTLELIHNPQTWSKLSTAACNRAKDFSPDNLCQKFHSLLH